MTRKRHFKKASSLQNVADQLSGFQYRCTTSRGTSLGGASLGLLCFGSRWWPPQKVGGQAAWFGLWLPGLNSQHSRNHCGLSSGCGFPNPSWPVFSPPKNEDPGSTYLMVVVKHRLGISPKAFRTSPCPSHSNTQNTVSYYYHSHRVLEFLPWSIGFLLTSFWPDIPISQKMLMWVYMSRHK